MTKKKIAQAIRALEDDDGRVSAEVFVKAAENPDSPLHNQLEWDDSIAGHQHRLYQARAIIRRVEYEFKEDSHILSAPYYVRDPKLEGQDQGYVSVDQIKREPENAANMILEELSRVVSIMARVEKLARVVKMAEHVEFVSRQVAALKKKFLRVA